MRRVGGIAVLVILAAVSPVWAEGAPAPAANTGFTLYHDINVVAAFEFFFADQEEAAIPDGKAAIGETGVPVFLAWLCCRFNKMQTTPSMALSWTDLVHETEPDVLLKHSMAVRDKDGAPIPGAVPDGAFGAGHIVLDQVVLSPEGGQAQSVQRICGFWCEIDAAAAQAARPGVYSGTITLETTTV